MTNFVKDMLLIEGSEAGKLYKELSNIAALFIGPMFIGSLCLQFFGEYDFAKVIKKLLVVSVVMTSFYTLHTTSVDLSMKVANKTFKKISPKNVFRKKWYRATLSKKKKIERGSTWDYIKEFVTPALNDLIASSFFVTSSIFMSLLKYTYTSVYHLTYIFAGFSALLYFWGITEGALWGMVKSSLWCILLPFVFISILSLIGNNLEIKAASGINMFSEIETIIWLFCVSLMLLMCPLITWKLVNSEGIAASAPQMGMVSVLAGAKVLQSGAKLQSFYRQGKRQAMSVKDSFNRFVGGKDKEKSQSFSRSKGATERSSQYAQGVNEKSRTHSSQFRDKSQNSNISRSHSNSFHSSHKDTSKKSTLESNYQKNGKVEKEVHQKTSANEFKNQRSYGLKKTSSSRKIETRRMLGRENSLFK